MTYMKTLTRIILINLILSVSFLSRGQVTNWNAYNDFYFNTNYFINNSSPSLPPWPQTPSAAGQAWGYYDCNINQVNGYPAQIGTYFGPGGNASLNQVLYALADYQPLGPGEGQLGNVAGCADAWDAIGGTGLTRYSDNQSWGTDVGVYSQAWYPGAPGYGTTHANDSGMWLVPAWLGNAGGEGIGNVVTWTAPCDATYVFNCSFLIAANNPGNSFAVVDSLGGVEVPRTVGTSGNFYAYSFTNTYHAGDVVEFQVGSDYQAPAQVGFNANVQLVKITDWNAYGDFYWDSTNFANHSLPSVPPFPATPSFTGQSWGYYAANVNGYGGYPTNIGSYFGSGNNTSLGEVLLAMANYQPLGPGQGQIGGGVTNVSNGSGDAWDSTGGTGFARYGDDNGWGVLVGEYGNAWYPGAPGYGTPYANDGGLFLVPAYLGVPFSDGIASIVTWTAPAAGTYNFSGDFLPASNNPGFAYSIVDSTGGIEVPRTTAAESTYNNFGFQKTLNAGDVVEFQVGTAGQPASQVGFNCSINNTPTPAVLVAAERNVTNANEVLVQFNAPLYPPSVSSLANYNIPGVSVVSAILNPDDSTSVILTVNPGINSAKTLTVNGVANNFGQLPVATNSMALITVPINVPLGIGLATNAAQDTFSGSQLSPFWQSGAVNDDSTQSNYVFSQVFVQSNGVLHVHANTLSTTPANYWDPNYLIYVNPAYRGPVEDALIHFTIKNSNFSGSSLAGVAVGVSPDPYISVPEGGDCVRTVPSGYASSTNNYPFMMSCSDFVADEPAISGTNEDEFNLKWQVGQSYWLRISQTLDTNPATSSNPGGIISVKAWPGDGSTPEPANWQFSFKDPLPGGDATRSGYAAIRAGWGAGTIMDFDVDYFLVRAPGLPTITPTLPSQLVPQVGLGIAAGGGNAVISWPAGTQSAYELESCTQLVGGAWSVVATPAVAQGQNNIVTLPLNNQSAQFFRLVETH